MPKLFLRIVAFLLVPCLLVEPTLAATISHQPYCRTFELVSYNIEIGIFTEEALAQSSWLARPIQWIKAAGMLVRNFTNPEPILGLLGYPRSDVSVLRTATTVFLTLMLVIFTGAWSTPSGSTVMNWASTEKLPLLLFAGTLLALNLAEVFQRRPVGNAVQRAENSGFVHAVLPPISRQIAFRTGQAIIGYLLHGLTFLAVKHLYAGDASFWYFFGLSFGILFAIGWWDWVVDSFQATYLRLKYDKLRRYYSVKEIGEIVSAHGVREMADINAALNKANSGKNSMFKKFGTSEVLRMIVVLGGAAKIAFYHGIDASRSQLQTPEDLFNKDLLIQILSQELDLAKKSPAYKILPGDGQWSDDTPVPTDRSERIAEINRAIAAIRNADFSKLSPPSSHNPGETLLLGKAA